LQYPPVSADLTPHVVGRFVGGDPPARLTLERGDGQWSGTPVAIGADGGFVTTVTLVPRAASTFRIAASDALGAIEVEPPGFTIVQGLTIADPPLSRTIGVALASDHVQVYFERGAPPRRARPSPHHGRDRGRRIGGQRAAHPDRAGRARAGPPVPAGRDPRAARAIGRAHRAAGRQVELTIELDRRLLDRARLRAGARIDVDRWRTCWCPRQRRGARRRPRRSAGATSPRCAPARPSARPHPGDRQARPAREPAGQAERDIDAAHGGDADAAQKARRTLLEIDAALADADLARKWPERSTRPAGPGSPRCRRWAPGTDAERRLLDEVMTALDRAVAARIRPSWDASCA
jgi:molecular chaperone DnaK